MLIIIYLSIEANAQNSIVVSNPLLLSQDVLLQQISNKEYFSFLQAGEMDISNKAIINQIGNNHNTRLQQNGSGNEANLLSTGLSTSTEINQNGDWNKVLFSLENKDDFLKAAQVLQTGNNNLVDLKITGNRLFGETDTKDAVITQNGNNNSFSGVMESYKSPIIVNQQAGPNGEGMKVDISTSDFYLPMK